MKKLERIIVIFIGLLLALCVFKITSEAKERTYEYDANGRVTKVLYEDGSYEVYRYDKNGNIVCIMYYPSDETNPVVVYPGGGDSTTETKPGTTAQNETTSEPTSETEQSVPTTESGENTEGTGTVTENDVSTEQADSTTETDTNTEEQDSNTETGTSTEETDPIAETGTSTEKSDPTTETDTSTGQTEEDGGKNVFRGMFALIKTTNSNLAKMSRGQVLKDLMKPVRKLETGLGKMVSGINRNGVKNSFLSMLVRFVAYLLGLG